MEKLQLFAMVQEKANSSEPELVFWALLLGIVFVIWIAMVLCQK